MAELTDEEKTRALEKATAEKAAAESKAAKAKAAQEAKIAEEKAALVAKNEALAGKFMEQDYDWVETMVQKTWLPNATAGKVVGSILEGVSGDAPVEHMVNLVRRAVHAHENRPVEDAEK